MTTFVYCVVSQGKSNLFSVKNCFPCKKRPDCFLWAAKSFVIYLLVWVSHLVEGILPWWLQGDKGSASFGKPAPNAYFCQLSLSEAVRFSTKCSAVVSGSTTK